MKKILSLILVLAVMLVIPFAVKADMGAPEAVPVEMVVTNPDGIECHGTGDKSDVKITIKKDEKFTLTYEYNGSYDIEYKGENYVIDDYSGATLVSKELDPTKVSKNFIKKLDKENEAFVYGKSGVVLTKGPHSSYDDITNIKYGTKLKYQYYIGNDVGREITHIYVTYKGKKGWVDILESKVLLKTDSKFIAMNDTTMACATVPKNTILNAIYESDDWSGSAMFKYKDCTDVLGLKWSEDLVYIEKAYATAKKSLDVYEYANDGGKKLTTIPEGAEFVEVARYAQMGEDEVATYVSYNGVEGWIYTDFSNYEVSDKEYVEETTTVPTTTKAAVKDKDMPDNFVLMCCIAGGACALAAVIVIILVNKKKKAKKVVEDKKEEEE